MSFNYIPCPSIIITVFYAMRYSIAPSDNGFNLISWTGHLFLKPGNKELYKKDQHNCWSYEIIQSCLHSRDQSQCHRPCQHYCICLGLLPTNVGVLHTTLAQTAFTVENIHDIIQPNFLMKWLVFTVKPLNTRCTKSQNLNISFLLLQLSLTNPCKPGVKSKIKM